MPKIIKMIYCKKKLVYLQLLSINNGYFKKKTYIPVETLYKNVKKSQKAQIWCTPKEQKLKDILDLFISI